jgi:hypothetical protein
MKIEQFAPQSYPHFGLGFVHDAKVVGFVL